MTSRQLLVSPAVVAFSRRAPLILALALSPSPSFLLVLSTLVLSALVLSALVVAAVGRISFALALPFTGSCALPLPSLPLPLAFSASLSLPLAFGLSSAIGATRVSFALGIRPPLALSFALSVPSSVPSGVSSRVSSWLSPRVPRDVSLVVVATVRAASLQACALARTHTAGPYCIRRSRSGHSSARRAAALKRRRLSVPHAPYQSHPSPCGSDTRPALSHGPCRGPWLKRHTRKSTPTRAHMARRAQIHEQASLCKNPAVATHLLELYESAAARNDRLQFVYRRVRPLALGVANDIGRAIGHRPSRADPRGAGFGEATRHRAQHSRPHRETVHRGRPRACCRRCWCCYCRYCR